MFVSIYAFMSSILILWERDTSWELDFSWPAHVMQHLTLTWDNQMSPKEPCDSMLPCNSAWRRFSEPAWAMTGGVFKSQRWRCDVIAGKDRLVCWLVSHALMHSLKRTPGSRAEAHAQCRHTHGKHTILHICTKWHTAAECIKGKRLHHLVVWHEVASECCRIHKLNFSIKY